MIALSEREHVVQWIDEAQATGARQDQSCALLGLSPRTLQRWQQSGALRSDRRGEREFVPANKLSESERARILAVANAPEFGQLPPSQIVPILADRGDYVASESTFYRVLREAKQLAHRHPSRPRQSRARPKALQATAPNQLYSWDITYLPTAIRGLFFYLYLVLDLYSRKIVGWRVEAEERGDHAAALVVAIARREGITPAQLVLHSDNGGPMKGATLRATLQQLGIEPSFSRPAVSNDNPYSESLFRTVKYRPEYPTRPFSDLADARQWVARFIAWYNHQHRHSAIRFVTPAQRHAALDSAILHQRRQVYEAARLRHPERWRGPIRNWQPISVVYLNREKPHDRITAHVATHAA